MAYKRLSFTEWTDVDRKLIEGIGASAIAREYGVSEGAIRKRQRSNASSGMEIGSKRIVEMRLEERAIIDPLPVVLQKRMYSMVDTQLEIIRNLSLSSELGSKTSHRLAAIANLHASKLDDENPDPESIKMVHALTETANKAAYQPVEMMKAMRASMPVQADEVRTVDPAKISTGALHEVLAARRSLQST